jgi:hypothetical protein
LLGGGPLDNAAHRFWGGVDLTQEANFTSALSISNGDRIARSAVPVRRGPPCDIGVQRS